MPSCWAISPALVGSAAALTAPRIFTIVGGGCSVNQAFVEIVRTAKAHNVSTLSLADALVALAQNQAPQDGETPRSSPPALRGGTLSPEPVGPRRAIDDEDDGVPGA